METTGHYVRRMRKLRKLRLEDVAEKVGINFSTLAKKEVNNGPWADEELKSIASALGIPLNVILNLRASDIQRAQSPQMGLQEPTRLGRLELVQVPVLGRVPAGAMREAIMTREDVVLVPGADVATDFALRVSGDSMVPTMMNGDLAICRRIDPYDNGVPVNLGDMVVVTTDDHESAFYRWVRSEGARVLLAKDNPNYDGRWIERESIVALAKVTGVLRRFQ